MFADDAKLYSVITSGIDVQDLQDNIFKAREWANKQQVTFNVKKCKSKH